MWFRRRRDHPAGPGRGGSAGRAAGDAEGAFWGAVREACMRLGCTVEPEGPQRARLYGRISGLVDLTEIRQELNGLPPERWAAVAHTHLAALARAQEAAVDLRTYATAAPALRSRLSAPEAVPPGVLQRPLAEGLVEVLTVLSAAGGVGTVPLAAAAGWGRLPDELFERARHQVLDDGLLTRTRVDLGGVEMTVVESASTFTATHLLWLPTYVDVPSDGALVAAPTRTLVMAHPLVDRTALDAIQALLLNATRLHRDGPQQLSPMLYWWRPGAVLTALPARVGEHSIDFHPPGDFLEVLQRLSPDR